MYKKYLQPLSRELSGERAYSYLLEIATHHRIQASPGFREAAHNCQQILARNGLQAEVLTYTADGDARNWASQVPREWKVRRARLQLILNKEPGDILADYHHNELSIIQRTGPLASEKGQGEIVVGDDKDNLPEMAGKWLLTRMPPEEVRRPVQVRGALGIIYDGMPALPPVREEGGLPHNRQYASFWGRDEKENPPGFVLTPSRGAELRRRLQKGEKILVRGEVDATFYPGTIENVSLLIPGEQQDEILLIAHLCHPRPSAGDNASGAAVLLEVAVTLNKLLESGLIPRPRYGIRFLWVPEMTGTYAYLASLAEEEPPVLGGLNLDMVGQKQEIGGGTLIVERPPQASSSWGADLLQSMLQDPYFCSAHNPYKTATFPAFSSRSLPFSGGSDHYILSDPTVNIPCPMLIQWPDRHYHTDADQPGNIDPHMLKNVGVLAATYAAFFAAGKADDLNWLLRKMVASFSRDLGSYIRGQEISPGQLQWLASCKNRHLQDLQRVHPELELDAVQKTLQELTLALKPLATGEEDPPPELPDLIPRRLFPGPVDQRLLMRELDRIGWRERFVELNKEYENKGVPCRSYLIHLLYWIDGQRTLAEAVENTQRETGVSAPGLALDYCRILEKLQLMELKTRT